MMIRNRIIGMRWVRAGDLLRNPKNWRRHPKAQRDALLGLLVEIGFVDALLVRELPDGRLIIIDGHLRAETTPDMLVLVLVLDVTEEEEDKILLTLDPLAAMAESDVERIKALLQTVRTDDAAVQELLKRAAGPKLWADVHPNEVTEVEVSPERADQLRKKYGTQLGQFWRVGPHYIGCGDCTDETFVARLWGFSDRRFRMIWTDPPWGVSYADKTTYLKQYGAQRSRRPIENDSLASEEVAALFSAALENAVERAEPGAALYVFVPAGPLLPVFIAAMQQGGFGFRQCLVWTKQAFVLGRSDYHYRHELVLYGWLENGRHYFTDDRTQDSVFDFPRPIVSDLHPTTKPVELAARMIVNSSQPGERVYDPFLGSGSMLIAAHQLGRICCGLELDPGYVAVVLERLSLLGLRPELIK
jgi:DNA modification methylase